MIETNPVGQRYVLQGDLIPSLKGVFCVWYKTASSCEVLDCRECGVLLSYYYSQILSKMERLNLLTSPSMVN